MKTILVIEDNQVIRDNVAEILSLDNYNVLKAPNGKVGIEMAQKHVPDLILCDIMMAGIDGYGVLHVLHKDPVTQAIPFIFLTSKTERRDFRMAMELGADDYLTKPCGGNELLSAIESRFRKNDIMRRRLAPDLESLNDLIKTSGTNTKTLEEVTGESQVNTYHKKQLVYREGGNPHYLFYILEGKVKTYKTHDEGKDLVVGLYSKGDFLGYNALLAGTNNLENAEAMEDTELALIPRKVFEELMNSNPDTARKFVNLLSKNVIEKEKQLLGIAYNTLRKKVAEAMVALHKKYHANQNEHYRIDISRDDLATIAGTAMESLVRTLSDFKKEGLIDIKNTDIIITDFRKLENLIR
jgi:CRP-like cAMP-binding protein